jgi:hypothetical protein
MLAQVVKGNQKGQYGITNSVLEYLKTADMIPPTRDRTGSVGFRINFRILWLLAHSERSRSLV